MDMKDFFVASLDVRRHPVKKSKAKIRAEYISALTYVVEMALKDKQLSNQNEKYIDERIRLYRTHLSTNVSLPIEDEKMGEECLSMFTKPWRKKYLFMLICDAALILLDKSFIDYAAMAIKENLSRRRQIDIDNIVSLMYDRRNIDATYTPASSLIEQYRSNDDFFRNNERRIIVTANMSAGKSTLINALIGKPIARISQEACTGNVCYLFNKAYEDGNIYLLTPTFNLSATADDLHGYDWNERISTASYFTGIASNVPRVCVIDTPGVDAALYKEHSERAYNALLNEKYDIIIYIVSPTRLGTEAEKKHLKWVAQNLRDNKIIFVMNKLDDYHAFSDSVYESVCNFKDDLTKMGFVNPVICPISAYFSYLLKLKITGYPLSEDEEDEYAVYSKKFLRYSYDLSKYYRGVQCLPSDSEEITLSKRAGLYGLEKIIYGGRA